MSPTRLHQDQSGVALVFALLAVIILGGLAVVFVSRAYTEQRATASEQRYETSIHVAEAGVDHLISILNVSDNFDTLATIDSRTGDPHQYDPASSSPEDEKAWALDIANNGCHEDDLVQTAVGEACVIRPEIATDSPANFIFGVGFVPNRDAAQKVRVIKIGIALGAFIPEKAILTDGDLNPFNITICGQDRDVHSNGSIHVKGGGDTVTPGTNSDGCDEDGSGDVTSVGSFTTEGNPDIGPGSGQTGPPGVDVPPISARQVYHKFLDPDPDNEHFDQKYADNWYNLCIKSGQMEVQRPYTVLGPRESLTLVEPCTTGQVVYNSATATSSHFKGWRLATESTGIGDTSGAFKCSPCFKAGGGSFPLESGIYYAYEANTYMSGNSPSGIQVSILAEATGDVTDPDARYSSPTSAPVGDSCTFNGRHNGNIGLEGVGGGGGEPFLENQLLLADRDVAMGGNFKSTVRGVIAAREQVGMSGQPSIVGALVTKDACPSSGDSPVSKNSVTGSFELDHTSINVSALPSVVNITAWSEY